MNRLYHFFTFVAHKIRNTNQYNITILVNFFYTIFFRKKKIIFLREILSSIEIELF
jgi:hypothetical protein